MKLLLGEFRVKWETTGLRNLSSENERKESSMTFHKYGYDYTWIESTKQIPISILSTFLGYRCTGECAHKLCDVISSCKQLTRRIKYFTGKLFALWRTAAALRCCNVELQALQKVWLLKCMAVVAAVIIMVCAGVSCYVDE